jgi:hypothetical protein
MIQTIDELIDFITEAKKNGTNKGISIQAISHLMFVGGLDSLFPSKPNLEQYLDTYERLKKALKSIAKLPKKRKGENIGLADVAEHKNEHALAYWRYENNPLAKANFIEDYLKEVGEFGFKQIKPGVYQRAGQSDPHSPNVLLHSRWSQIMAVPQIATAMMVGGYQIAGVGMIIKNDILKYQGSKERMSIRIYTGLEETDPITLWSKTQNGNKISASDKEKYSLFSVGLLIAKVNEYRGKPSYSVANWYKFEKGF